MICIEYSKKTVTNLKKRLNLAIKWNNPKLVIRITGLLMLTKQIPGKEIADMLDITERTLYNWRNEFISKGSKSLQAKRNKGRESKLSESQKQKLREIILRKPEEVGFLRGTWTSTMITELIEKKFKVSYNRRYVCDLLKQMGFSYQKGKYISDQYDSEQRILWKNETWPNLLKRAKQEEAVILFVDEVGFSLWGSLGYSWSLKGQQPLVKTSGKRKNLKVFGAIDYFSGRLIFQTEDDKLNSKSYKSFLNRILARFDNKIILVHDGAPYHKSKATKDFIDSIDRIEAIRLPSYSPEFNIIEYLWKKAKAKTHNKYFSDFQSLKSHVGKVLRSLQKNLSELLGLCSSYDSMLCSALLKAS